MNRPFTSQLWAQEIADNWQSRGMFVEPAQLKPGDYWGGQDAGHYDEACAFAKILKITVYNMQGESPGIDNCFRLHRQGWAPRVLEHCSPAQLIEELRRFAAAVPTDPPYSSSTFVLNPARSTVTMPKPSANKHWRRLLGGR